MLMCLAAPSRLSLHPAARHPHGVRLPPWRLGISSSCMFCNLVSRQLTICNANSSNADDLWVSAPQSPETVRSRLLAKAVLSLFLRLKGLGSTQAQMILNKSDGFIEHLVSKLLGTYRSRLVEGRELSAPEISAALLPYLKALSREHGDGFVEVVENFPNPFSMERVLGMHHEEIKSLGRDKQRIIAQISRRTSGGSFHELVLFLLELGMDHEEIKNIVLKFPSFAYYNVDRNTKPLVELLIELGVPRSSIPGIIKKWPQLCGISCDNLRETAEYFRSIGVDVASLIQKWPRAFNHSVEEKLKPVTEFFIERGFSMEEIRIMVNRFGNIYLFSLERNLLPKYDFFLTMEYPRGELVNFPYYFGFSLEQRIKPRYARMTNCGLRLSLNRMLTSSDSIFEETPKGRELNAPEISDALLPYLEALSKEHGDGFVEVVGNFPNPFSIERVLGMGHKEIKSLGRDKQRAIARISRRTSGGAFHELVLFLLELGMDHEEIKNIVLKFPSFAYYNVDRTIKPLVELLIELGVPRSNIPGIIKRRPQLCGISSDNLRATAEYFRSIGVDVASLIQKCPRAFSQSVETKLKPITKFFIERGFSMEEIRIMVNRFGNLYLCSLEGNLLPKYDFFLMMEYPRGELLNFPKYFGYSLEQRIKPRYAQMTNCGVRLRLWQMLTSFDAVFEAILEKEDCNLRR